MHVKKFLELNCNKDMLFPYSDKEFSEKMLIEHLQQDTNGASRQQKIIKNECNFISDLLSESNVFSVIDIGCGAGLHVNELTRLGFSCHGVDVSPAAIEYAEMMSSSFNDSASFYCSDIYQFKTKLTFDSAIVLYGLINEQDGLNLFIEKVKSFLSPNGIMILEFMKPDYLTRLLNSPLTVNERDTPSCFSINPHVRVVKRFFDDVKNCFVNRSLIIDTEDEIKVYESNFYYYSVDEIVESLESCGLRCVNILEDNKLNKDYFYVIASV